MVHEWVRYLHALVASLTGKIDATYAIQDLLRNLLKHMQTGRSDIPLTARGEEEVASRADILVGEGSKIDGPSNLNLF